jgi:hypothetical protein
MTFDFELLERRNLFDGTLEDLAEHAPLEPEEDFSQIVCILYGETDSGETPQIPPGLSLREVGDPWFANDFGGFGYLGSFFDSSKSAPTDYIVNVEWGDGTTSPGYVFESFHGGLDVFAIHAYRELGDHEFSVKISKSSQPEADLRIDGTAHVFQPDEFFCPGPIILPEEMIPLASQTGAGEPSQEQPRESAGRAPDTTLMPANAAGIASEVFRADRRIDELDPATDDLSVG